MNDTIKVLYKEPYTIPREVTIPNELEMFQKLVDGPIQAFPAVTFTGQARRIVVICDEEAKLRETPPAPNLFLGEPPRFDIVRGPVVVLVCVAEEEWFDGLTEDELQIAEAWLRMVEIVKGGLNG